MAAEFDPKPDSGGYSSTVNGGMTVEECLDMIRRSLITPMVEFLREHLEKAGCSIGDKFMKAVPCDKEISGGYVRGQGCKLDCSNHMNIQDEGNQVVIQSSFMLVTIRAANLDWANCAHHAWREIRAGHLSGNCHYKRELLLGFVKIQGHEQECVRKRVMKSVIANPYCSEAAA